VNNIPSEEYLPPMPPVWTGDKLRRKAGRERKQISPPLGHKSDGWLVGFFLWKKSWGKTEKSLSECQTILLEAVDAAAKATGNDWDQAQI